MDQAARGASALSSGDFSAAIQHYTDAISQNSGAVDYYVKRSTAYTRASPPDHVSAFKDAEGALNLASKRGKRELIIQSQLRRAIALYGLERYADSEQCFQWVKKLDEKEKSLAIWETKVKNKLNGLPEEDERRKVSVKQIPDTPSDTRASPKESNNGVEEKPAEAVKVSKTPVDKIRHDWIQNNDIVTVTLYCKGLQKDETEVDITSTSLEVDFPLSNESTYSLSLSPLFANIDADKSAYKILSTKAEFTLVKAEPGRKWSSLEGSEANGNGVKAEQSSKTKDGESSAVKKPEQKGPTYPTSSKSGPKNWDKLASDLSKRPKKNPKEGEEGETEEPGLDEEEGDPTTNFFKTLYSGADPDTRRAMMKSYQESNGTALSTNWSEVGKGPVETSPPDGMEAKKWGA